MSKFRILFLCYSDSGRSQMAGALAKKFAPRNTEIVCASASEKKPHPLALKIIYEEGIDISDLNTAALNDIWTDRFDLVVTLCDQAKEICPTFPGAPTKIHWSLENPLNVPVKDSLTKAEIYRKLRNEINERLEGLFKYGFLESIMQTRMTFSTLLENLTDGVMAYDCDRRIYYFNHSAQKITGYEFSEVIGQDCHKIFNGRFCGSDCTICKKEGSGKTPFRFPLNFPRKDGQNRELEVSIVEIKTPHGTANGALVIYRDLTEMIFMRRRLTESSGFYGIIGHHISMQRVFDSIRELSNVNVPILIQGESGTGKEMVAAALHAQSSRSGGPFVPVNCGALPEGTLESELFGHVKGAFTGAIRDKKGRFELAENGTIFLDEIGEMSLNTQVKLLRVLQSKTFVPVGGEKSITVDVRIICATNKELKDLTQKGLFREDLFYRLAVVPINLPPLREKKSDIPLLIQHFLQKYLEGNLRKTTDLTADALELMIKYSWPGNVRELRNAIQYALIKCHGDIIDVPHLPPELTENLIPKARPKAGRKPKLDEKTLREALERAGSNRARAARLLGVSRTTLYRALAKMKV